MDLIHKYFPGLDSIQTGQFMKLLEVVPKLNKQVNVISRKDTQHLEERHVLHSLSIAKQFTFRKNQSVIDAGTGGGFPGIPLAILFPETHFTLVDSIGKKIRLVQEISAAIDLKNVTPIQERVEQLEIRADFVVSRAVASFSMLYKWTNGLIRAGSSGLSNGLIALKGGNLDAELNSFQNRVELYPVSRWFQESFFSEKSIVYLKK